MNRNRIGLPYRVISAGGTPGSGGSFTIGPEIGTPPTVGVAMNVSQWELSAGASVAAAVTVPTWEFSAGSSLAATMTVPDWEFSTNTTAGSHMSATAQFTQTAQSRSGAPDSDKWGDAWTDAAIGQTGTNHGNESPIIAASIVGAERRAYVKVDLRGFSKTATGNAHTITCRVMNSSLIAAQTLRLRAGGNGSTSPFTESTIAQNNQPAIPTDVDITSGNVAANTTQTLTFTLTDTQMNELLGEWALLLFTSAGLSDMRIVSREGTAADRIALNFTLLGSA